MSYNQSFIHTSPDGNNALSYETRLSLKGEAKLFVPNLINGNLNDVQLGDQIVFEDFDDKGNLISAKGLKHFIRAEILGTTVIIFDNHNHALYFWYESLVNGLISKGATLLHIDQHSDMNINPNIIDSSKETNLDYIFEYTNFQTNVGNYILPARQAGLIDNIVQIRTEYALENINKSSLDNNIILNIDLDFWAPEMDLINNNLKYEVTKDLIKRSKLVTIATSPFFIDQQLALEVLNKIFS